MTDLEKLQDETIELIKNKKGNKNMNKSDKVSKTIKVSTLIKAIIAIVVLLSLGAFTGITIDRAIKSTIDNQVQSKTAEQVKVFTEAVEAKK